MSASSVWMEEQKARKTFFLKKTTLKFWKLTEQILQKTGLHQDYSLAVRQMALRRRAFFNEIQAAFRRRKNYYLNKKGELKK